MILAVIYMDEPIIYAYAVKTGGYQSFDNPVTSTGLYALDIHGTAKSMHGLASTTTGKFMLDRSESGIEDERNAGNRAGRLQTFHKRLIHILKRA